MTGLEERYEERAAIFEYECGMTRGAAETAAFILFYGQEKLDTLNAPEWFQERAAIFEYDGGMSREKAEALAHDLVYNKGELFHANRRRSTTAPCPYDPGPGRENGQEMDRNAGYLVSA
jgi:hypothetical protein